MKILSYPKKIIPGHKLSFILKMLDITHTNDINDDNITHVIHYDYKNENEVTQEILSLGLPIINKHCTNVKKDYVDQIFSEIFGYTLFLDPKTHRGNCIEKSTQQAIHGAKIVSCPREPDTAIRYSATGISQTRTYQKIIDTRFEKDKLRELRVPIIGNEIKTIFVKELGVKNMFHPYPENYYKVYMASPEGYLWPDEIEKLEQFSKKFSFDFAEVDVLRSNYDGLIYVVDVNNIPMGSLFNHLDNKIEAINVMANQFKKLLK
jgi:hypothetical protein